MLAWHHNAYLQVTRSQVVLFSVPHVYGQFNSCHMSSLTSSLFHFLPGLLQQTACSRVENINFCRLRCGQAFDDRQEAEQRSWRTTGDQGQSHTRRTTQPDIGYKCTDVGVNADCFHEQRSRMVKRLDQVFGQGPCWWPCRGSQAVQIESWDLSQVQIHACGSGWICYGTGRHQSRGAWIISSKGCRWPRATDTQAVTQTQTLPLIWSVVDQWSVLLFFFDQSVCSVCSPVVFIFDRKSLWQIIKPITDYYYVKSQLTDWPTVWLWVTSYRKLSIIKLTITHTYVNWDSRQPYDARNGMEWNGPTLKPTHSRRKVNQHRLWSKACSIVECLQIRLFSCARPHRFADAADATFVCKSNATWLGRNFEDGQWSMVNGSQWWSQFWGWLFFLTTW